MKFIDVPGRQGGVSGMQSFMSDDGLKRTREDDMIASASCKKII